MIFRQLFDRESCTYTYLLADLQQQEAILVDPVLEQVKRDLQLICELNLKLRCCLETHIHADHLTGTAKLRQLTGCLGVVPDKTHAECADLFITDGETIELGSIKIKAIATPGHTDSHMAYLVNHNKILTGDALLVHGCGRTDFQSGDAGKLYDSVTQKLFTLPDSTRVYPGHDYHGYTVSTIGEEKKYNPRFAGLNREDFTGLMSCLELSKPKKIMEAIPANEQCGKIPVTVA